MDFTIFSADKTEEVTTNGAHELSPTETDDSPSNKDTSSDKDTPSDDVAPSKEVSTKEDGPKEEGADQSQELPDEVPEEEPKSTEDNQTDQKESSSETKPDYSDTDDAEEDDDDDHEDVDDVEEGEDSTKDVDEKVKREDIDGQKDKDDIVEEEVVIEAKKIKTENEDSGQEDVDSVDMEYSSGEVAAILRATTGMRQSNMVASEIGSPKAPDAASAEGDDVDGDNIIHRFRYNEDESSLEEMSPARRAEQNNQSAKTIALSEQELMEKQEQRREEIERLAKINEVAEREGAREYCQSLIALLPVIIPIVDTYEVDEMIQKFSSRFVTSKFHL